MNIIFFLHYRNIHLLCLAHLGTSMALERPPHLSACMSGTWRLVVARLLDNLKWNNSASGAQTRVGVCVRASAKGVRARKVFFASRNVNNSPSTVHINFPTGGRRERGGTRERRLTMGGG